MPSGDSSGEGPFADQGSLSPDPSGLEDDGFVGASGDSPSPNIVGDYQLVARLGGGSMAELYVARKVSQFGFVHRAVIKQVKRSRPDFRQLQRMLLDEARATACFDHPNLVSIFDVGESEQGLYLALEHVDGTDLRRVNQKLRSRKEALPFELACYIVSEVLRGVHHAHTARGPDGKPLEIVHRDVNPSNVLVATSGHVKLADFGVVRMRERIQPKTEPGLVKGKYAYLAPEYIAGEPCSVQTDVYAAGIMLFELLSGRECFTGTTAYEVMWKIVNKGVPMYRLQREGVPEDLQRLVARATSMVPERRYSTAQDMANALEAWLMRSHKHATPWVLSVFFHRHDLFQKPIDQGYQSVGTSTPAPSGLGVDGGSRDGFASRTPTNRPAEPVTGSRPSADRAAPLLQPARDVVDDSLTPAPDLAGDGLSFLPGGPDDQQLIETPRDPAPQLGLDAEPALASPGPTPFEGRAGRTPFPTQPAVVSGTVGTGAAPAYSSPPPAYSTPPPGDIPPDEAPTPTSSPGVHTELDQMPDANELVPPSPGPLEDLLSSANTSDIDPEKAVMAQNGRRGPVVDTSDLATPRTGVSPKLEPDAGPSLGSTVRNGKLEEHPAADVLERLAQDQASGVIEFRCGLIWKRVLMTEGKPTGVTSNMGMELIGEHLVKARIISREDLEKALQNSERLSKPLTLCLLEQGALTREALEIELGRNLGARLKEVLDWRWGTYEFTPQTMAPVEILPKLDLDGLLSAARANRSEQDAKDAEDETVAAAPGKITPRPSSKRR